MKRKTLLVTIGDIHNFGNRLQNYALQHKIELTDTSVNNLMVQKIPLNIKLKNMLRAALMRLGINKYRISLSIWKRAEKVIAFNKKYMPQNLKLPVDEVRRTDWSSYDFAIAGSDQVWHNWHSKSIPDELSYYYLEFIDEAKRVSYAPSFGFTTFPPEDIEQHRRGLMGMHALSCREKEGCELIHELTGREATKVLDPTLLLTAAEWTEIEKKPDFKTPAQYLLQFFLGNITREYREEIDRIAAERGLRIININDKNDPKHYAIGPDEFVWLIHHADTICTDSFHASVFSITFERNLRVFHRRQEGFQDMFGRLHDLLEPLGLMDVVYGEGEELSTVLKTEVKQTLLKEREKSLLYLKESFRLNEN